MRYKSVGLAALALVFGAVCAEAANMIETRAFTSGLTVSNSGGYRLESTVGEVSGSTMAASGKGLRAGHSSASANTLTGVQTYDTGSSIAAAAGQPGISVSTSIGKNLVGAGRNR
ncbi:MAG: hypothetical protein HY796_08285 [Elusimicrobia bacterium]|nr:hypothetical protein [Elusimicrobiota bacterium]